MGVGDIRCGRPIDGWMDGGGRCIKDNIYCHYSVDMGMYLHIP